MSGLVIGIVCALVGVLGGWLATTLPSFRQQREYKRQLHQTIVGVPKSAGVEFRPALVDRVVDVETAVRAVGVSVAEYGETAAQVAKALPRIEAQVGELTGSHSELAGSLHAHMKSEEAAILDMQAKQAVERGEIQASIDAVGSALSDHAECDLAVAHEIRQIASQASSHADAARAAAERAATAATNTHERLVAISTAVGAEAEAEVPEPSSRRE